MNLLKEFREFAMRGNVIDLAVGVIIGAAFGLVVKSLVDDVMMPPLGYLIGGMDFSQYTYTLVDADAETNRAAVIVSWGKFLNSVVTFMIQAMAVFLVIKVVNTATKRLQAEKEAAPAAKAADVVVLEEIRDLLARKG